MNKNGNLIFGPRPIQYNQADPNDPDFWVWRIGEQNFVNSMHQLDVRFTLPEAILPWPAWLFESESHASMTENLRRNPGWRSDEALDGYSAGMAYASGYHD